MIRECRVARFLGCFLAALAGAAAVAVFASFFPRGHRGRRRLRRRRPWERQRIGTVPPEWQEDQVRF
ncbi:hypothetical protein E1293_12070 [Actinomadura darangshiensis]|uniref:Uncharacterized protein n=1 Tax=Actinomadura darangshiensis TaxID=705336 RepID=A0A4R5BM61_9ACTN|nr:hypothetical protein [Actinomadura darangshiensis]TDD85012.1 hypothetical protein E1293_12070 [Actinomadura darangshiensis]